MLLTNPRLSQSIKVYDDFINQIGVNPLSHKKRSFFGQVYINYFGVDMDYDVRGRILVKDDYASLLNFSGDVVRVNEWEEADGEYYMDKLKIKKFSLENNWYHVTFSLTKNYIQK